MNIFLVGIAVGVILFGVLATVSILYKMQQEITRMVHTTENMHKALQMIFVKVTKVDKTTQTMMEGIESFVDGLRQATEMMFSRPPHEAGNFEDLTKSFEDGIRKFEDEIDEEDDEEEGPTEGWKQ